MILLSSWTNKNAILSELCRRAAEELLGQKRGKQQLQEEPFGKASTKPVKSTLGLVRREIRPAVSAVNEERCVWAVQEVRNPILHYSSLFDAKCSFAFLPQQRGVVTLIFHNSW